jgi:hypothetical protein
VWTRAELLSLGFYEAAHAAARGDVDAYNEIEAAKADALAALTAAWREQREVQR